METPRRLFGRNTIGWLVLAIAGCPALAAAGDETTPQESPTPKQFAANFERDAKIATHAPSDVAVVYRPPSRGAPRRRTGGSTRSDEMRLSVQALAPEHVARTVQAAPSLYWHIDAATPLDTRAVFTLNRDESIEPIASFDLPTPRAPGIQRISLAEHGVKLEPGMEYEWSVAIVLDPDKRSRDIVSQGWLRRVEAPQLNADVTPAATLAQLSLWYDAFERLSDDIDASPSDSALLAQRNGLLRQIDLGDAVE